MLKKKKKKVVTLEKIKYFSNAKFLMKFFSWEKEKKRKKKEKKITGNFKLAY